MSGGAKAVMPGVAGLDTIQYNHWALLPRTKTAGTFKVFQNEVRLDMIEAARMAQVDFTVQIVTNQNGNRSASIPATSWGRTRPQPTWRSIITPPRRRRMPTLWFEFLSAEWPGLPGAMVD